jgi:hypothetical protein
MHKFYETNQMGATTSFKRKSRSMAVVFKTTSAATALLALGFMTLPCAMADTQVITGDTPYDDGLSVVTAVASDNGRQIGLHVTEGALVTGKKNLSIKVEDTDTPPEASAL